ncbi:MAG TPA: hypothetical protein VEB42_07850, partial [Chitinophagaceae bacterium]|nr:hypothetical protein [Chitinophagaceae bacterium]
GGRSSVNHNTGTFLVHGTSTLVIENGFEFTVSGTGFINGWINISSGGTLNIQNGNNLKLSNLHTNSTVTYNSSAAGVCSPRNGQAYGNVIIANSTSLSPTFGATVAIKGALTINAGQTLTMGAVPLVMQGVGTTMFDGPGFLRGGATSTLSLAGGNGGNNGAITFATGAQTLRSFSLNFNSGTDYVVINNSLTVTGGNFVQNGGGIDFSNTHLVINGNVSFPPSSAQGAFRGNETASLTLGFSSYRAPVQSSIFFNPAANNLRALRVNTSTLSVTAGNSLVIHDSLSVATGTLNANNMITINSHEFLRGRVGRVGATARIEGLMRMETYISGGSTGWMNLGVPGVSNQIVRNWNRDFPMSCALCQFAPIGGTFVSIQAWNEPTSAYVPL